MASVRKVKSKPRSTAALSWLTSASEMVPIDSVREHPRNARRGDVDRIRRSMRKHGVWGSLIVQRSTGFVLAGNHRLRAMRAEKMTEVSVQWADVDDAMARKILLADNRLADRATYDTEVLDDLLATFDDVEIEDMGFDVAPEEIEPGAEPELGDIEYRVVVDCDDERDQAQMLERLEKEGRKCRALMS